MTGQWQLLSHQKVPYGLFLALFVQVLLDLTLIGDGTVLVSVCDPVRTCVALVNLQVRLSSCVRAYMPVGLV